MRTLEYTCRMVYVGADKVYVCEREARGRVTEWPRGRGEDAGKMLR